MAFRITDFVVRGELDLTVRGRVGGRLWLEGRAEPLVLALEGSPLRDLAGCRLEFRNPAPKTGAPADLATEQDGVVGDLTASRKALDLAEPLEQARKRMDEGGKARVRRVNVLYLEWFSRRNGRVVIEAPDFQVTVSAPQWRMRPAEEAEQIEANRRRFRSWMEELDSAPEASPVSDADVEGPMDEFQWEKFLKDSDARSDRFGEVMEKYRDHPDADRLIAREMGWDKLEESIEADARGVFAEEKAADRLEEDDLEEEDPEPDPAQEGRTWVRDERGDLCHPVAYRARELSVAVYRGMERLGLTGADSDPACVEFHSCVSCCGAKLGGALNLLFRTGGRSHEPGLTVAQLKRALKFLNLALQAYEAIRSNDAIRPKLPERLQTEMFGLREDVLRLIGEFRGMLER